MDTEEASTVESHAKRVRMNELHQQMPVYSVPRPPAEIAPVHEQQIACISHATAQMTQEATSYPAHSDYSHLGLEGALTSIVRMVHRIALHKGEAGILFDYHHYEPAQPPNGHRELRPATQILLTSRPWNIFLAARVQEVAFRDHYTQQWGPAHGQWTIDPSTGAFSLEFRYDASKAWFPHRFYLRVKCSHDGIDKRSWYYEKMEGGRIHAVELSHPRVQLMTFKDPKEDRSIEQRLGLEP